MDPKNRLQEYYKKQSELGRQAVVKGRDKFAKDVMLPAAKTAASFTPIGPVIGLMDAKDMYNKGETGWAMFGASMEALPYAGKYAVKGINSALPTIEKVVKNTHKINPNKTSKVFFRPEVKASKSNDMWESIEKLYKKKKLRNSDDLIKAGQEAKTSVIDYINNPIIKETAERNTKLSHRLNLKMPYIIEGGVPRRVNNLQEFRQHNLSRPATLSFGHTGNNSLATYASELPALGEKSKITVSWQHFGPKKVLSDNRLKGSIEHELLHHSRFGESNIEQLKAEKLLKPRSELLAPSSTSLKYSGDIGQDAEPYLLSRGEAAANIRDLGKDLGFSVGLKYPGKSEGMKILNEILPDYKGYKQFVVGDLRLNTPRDYKRVWDALTGKYLGWGAAIGASQINKIEKYFNE